MAHDRGIIIYYENLGEKNNDEIPDMPHVWVCG